MDYKMPKHHYNLLKTVEGTGWILCDALNTMVRNNISSDLSSGGNMDSLLANNISEIFQVVAECEEQEVIDHLADKIIEFAGEDINSFLDYMGQNMGDNPLYKKVYTVANNEMR
ncbi:hypothetical protein [Sporosalibacterium faouarense]|uniref:hypothetical protein n=1 Tax=Sporosalibacterium faouarense TaxID=516123 RepID=UPI00141C12CE|nr:hypothetical protein [Sporosalibacterium faouarense]MTI49251.1 hypothetical protein [Bacillota bacterium]